MLIDMRSAPSYCFAMLDFTIVHFAFKAADLCIVFNSATGRLLK